MKLKVLVDNNTFIDEYYVGEPAVSYYIEDGDAKILFDTGYTDALIKNAKKMNINLNDLNKIVISHGHDDHTGGLKYLLDFIDNNSIELIAHKECFNQKIYKDIYIGSPVNKETLNKHFKVTLSKNFIKISEKIYFLGEIPEINNFEKRKIVGKTDCNNKLISDVVKDDTAIVYKSEQGLFIITGCSHSGICNITEYAKEICNEERIYGIIGGFHLFDIDERLNKTIKYLKDNQIKLLYPCHCVSLDAKVEMSKEIKINEVGVGLEINI